jgi:four helix bundle protein
LIAWQKAREVVVEIYRVTNSGSFSKDFGLRDQCRKSSVSVVSNIAEGFERKGNKEFVQFLWITLGSLGELQTQLYIASDIQYIQPSEADQLKTKIHEIKKIIGGLIAYLKKSDYKGAKYVLESEAFYEIQKATNN